MEDADKTTDDKIRGRYKSTFSMGLMDFERYNRILANIDVYSTRVWSGNDSAIRPLFALLRTFYYNIRNLPSTYVTMRAEIDKIEAETEKLIIRWEIKKKMNFSIRADANLKENLRLFLLKILEEKQMSGLGIEMNKELSEFSKWKRALRVSE